MGRTGKATHRSEARHIAMTRAAAAGTLMLGLAATAHAAAGGDLPPLPILAALMALTILGATLSCRMPLTFGTVLLLSGLCQQLLHLAFTLLTPVPGTFITPTNGGHHTVPLPRSPAPGDGSQGPMPQDPHADSAMLMLHAHTAAALLATAVISSWTTTRHRAAALIRRHTARRTPPPAEN